MAIFLFFWAVFPKATTRHPAGPVVFPYFPSTRRSSVAFFTSDHSPFRPLSFCVLHALIFSVFVCLSFFYASACLVCCFYHLFLSILDTFIRCCILFFFNHILTFKSFISATFTHTFLV